MGKLISDISKKCDFIENYYKKYKNLKYYEV